MKKILVAVAALGYAGLAVAGEFHVNDSLRCSQCHTMHASRQHGLNTSVADSSYPLSAQGTGHETLLLFPTVNATCLACHDGNSHIADVFGADAGGTWNRSAGALNAPAGAVPGHSAAGNANDALATAYDTFMGHTLTSMAPPPGYVGTWTPPAEGFRCSNCHSVHGSKAFRNLGAGLGNNATSSTVTYTIAAALDVNYDVTILGTENSFRTQDVRFGLGGNVANWKGITLSPPAGMNTHCANCHGRFHGRDGDATNGITDSAGNFVRHPVADPAGNGTMDIAATNLIPGAQMDLTRPLWVDNAQTSLTVGCLTCHKGHGNARGFALLYPGAMQEGTAYTGADSLAHLVGPVQDYEQGDGALLDAGQSYASYPIRNLCATCHSQSRTLRK